MQDSKAITTFLNNKVKLIEGMCPELDQEKSEMKVFPYLELIGLLMHLSFATRLGLA